MFQPGATLPLGPLATTVECLTQVVAEDELRDEEEYDYIAEDMKTEDGKFGALTNIVIPRPSPDGEPVAGVGKDSDVNSYDLNHESLLSEPPHISNWFSSYVYESPMLYTSDCLEFSEFGESEYSKGVEIKKETTKVENVSEWQVVFSEVVEDSDIDEENRSSIFRKPRSKKVTAPTYESEVTSLRNRVEYLEREVRILHDLFNRLQCQK